MLLGLAIAGLAIASIARPSRGIVVGVLGLGLGLVSLFAGSGFVIGGLLAVVGGACVAVFSRRTWTSVPPGGTGIRPEDLGRPCERCGHRVPPWSSTCPYCAADGERAGSGAT